MSQLIQCEYELDNALYSIAETAETHNKLQSDEDFLRDYVNKLNNVQLKTLTVTPDANDLERSFQWTEAETNLLLQLYKERKEQFKSGAVKKKSLWRDIARRMMDAGYTDITYEDADKKFRNMKTTFKKLLLRKYSEGVKIKWEYFNTFKELVSPEEMLVSTNPKNMNFMEDSMSFIEPMDPLETKIGVKMWTERATTYLMRVIEKNIHHYRNPEVKRGDFWKRVAKAMTLAGFKDITYDSCDVKFRNMKRTFLTLLYKLKTGEMLKTSWKYFEAFTRILPKESEDVRSMPVYVKEAGNEYSSDEDEYEVGNNYEGVNYKEVKYKDVKYKDAKYKDAKYKDVKYKVATYEDGKYENGKYEDGKYEDSNKYEDGNVDDLSERSYVCKEVIVNVPSPDSHYMLGNVDMEDEDLQFEEEDEQDEGRILVNRFKEPNKRVVIKGDDRPSESLKRKRMCKDSKRVVVPVIERRKLAELQSIKYMIQKLSKLQQENNQIQKERNLILSRLVDKMDQ